MKLFLLRHGESTGDIDGRFGGDYDDHLTDRGKAQARELATQLAGKDIEIIYTSPRKRAIETAEEIKKALNVSVQVIDDLRERNNYGVLTGLTKRKPKKSIPRNSKRSS